MTGWFYGMPAGIVAGLLGIMLDGVLAARITGTDPLSAIRTFWPGYLMIVVFGYLSGVLHRETAETARIRDKLRSREHFLVLISTVTKSIVEPGDPGDGFRRMVGYLTHIFAADNAYLMRWDEVEQQATLVAATESLGSGSPVNFVLPSEETAVIAKVLGGRRVVAIHSGPEWGDAVLKAVPGGHARTTQSALCLPLIMGDYAFGVVTLAFDTARRFTRDELLFAEVAGNQIALALWTMEQQLEIGKRLKEANALATIERALSETERVGLETILQLIVDSATELIPGAERATLHLIDNEQQILVPRAVAGIPEGATAPLKMRVGEGVAGQVIQTGSVISVSDTQADDRFLNSVTPAKFRSLITAPVQSNERRLGTISVQSGRRNAFLQEDASLLGALGTQAAIAIENANLLETTRKDLKEINALYRVNQGIAASLDPDQLMKDVVELLRENFGYYHVQCYMVDAKNGDLVARHGSGIIGDLLRERGHRLPPGSGIVGHVAETGQPFVTQHVDDVVFFIRNQALPDTTSELTVPIKIGDRVVGVLDIQRGPPGRLDNRDLQLVSSVANQLGVALQKAELYTELQASLKQENETRSQLVHSERLAVVGRLLASVSHELNNPLQAIQNALYLIKEESALTPQGRQDLEVVLSEAERMASLIGRLRSNYRPTPAEEFEEIELTKVVEDVHSLTATYMRHRKIAFEFYPQDDVPVILGIPDQIRQVVLNLFLNAIDAMPMDGRLTVGVRHVAEEGRVLLSVTDTGPGINPEILPRIFEPFVTDKETGTGLGLTITEDIVRQHQGTIQAQNLPQGGASFSILFPVKERERA